MGLPTGENLNGTVFTTNDSTSKEYHLNPTTPVGVEISVDFKQHTALINNYNITYYITLTVPDAGELIVTVAGMSYAQQYTGEEQITPGYKPDENHVIQETS